MLDKLTTEERMKWSFWHPIDTAPKDGTFIWLSDGFHMRIGYWHVVTKDPTQEHWADMALAEAHDASDLQWTPTDWMPLPKPPSVANRVTK